MGNLTQKHIEDVSMCALFLMDAAKKIDREFQCHHSSAHTEWDAERDISKLLEHLLDKTVVAHSPERNTPSFTDPTDTRYKKLCNTSWVQEILSKTGREDCDLDVEEDDMVDEDTDEIDLDYEIADVTWPYTEPRPPEYQQYERTYYSIINEQLL